MLKKAPLFLKLSRPFTLIPPATGIFLGGLTALGADPYLEYSESSVQDLVYNLLIGAIAASVLNAGNNALNQICDLKEDRINKPYRILPSEKLSISDSWIFSICCYIFSLGLVATINCSCFLVFTIAAIITFSYSVQPVRLKKRGMLANLAIALSRGILLWVAGWSTVKTVSTLEPWYIGVIFGLFVFGATTTKDFGDIEGDRVSGLKTLPIRFGIRKSAILISPFLIMPFFLIPIGAHFNYLSGNLFLLDGLSVVLVLFGMIVSWDMIFRPMKQSGGLENHHSWKFTYLIMICSQIGFSAAYLL